MDRVRRSIAASLGLMALTMRHGVAMTPTGAASETAALPALGAALALPELTLLDGSLFRPAPVPGRVTLIYWWASTCPFCALQSPEMEKFWLTHRSKGLQMLALSVDRTAQEAVTYLQKKGYTFPSAWVTPEVQRVLPKPRGLPVTLVRGRDGKLLQAERGQMFPEDVEQMAHWL